VTWRSTGDRDLPLAALWAVAAGSLVALAPLARLLTGFLPACPLHAVTGVPCPSCGATRAALNLADGEMMAALAINPLAALSIGLGVLGGLLAPAWVVLRGPLPVLARGRRARIALAAMLAVNWAYLVVRQV
jgi:hypothetical protein